MNWTFHIIRDKERGYTTGCMSIQWIQRWLVDIAWFYLLHSLLKWRRNSEKRQDLGIIGYNHLFLKTVRCITFEQSVVLFVSKEWKIKWGLNVFFTKNWFLGDRREIGMIIQFCIWKKTTVLKRRIFVWYMFFGGDQSHSAKWN